MMSRVDNQQILSYDVESGNEPGPHIEGRKYPQHCANTAHNAGMILLHTLHQYCSQRWANIFAISLHWCQFHLIKHQVDR